MTESASKVTPSCSGINTPSKSSRLTTILQAKCLLTILETFSLASSIVKPDTSIPWINTPFIILLLLMFISAKTVENASSKIAKIAITIAKIIRPLFRICFFVSPLEAKIIFSASCKISSISSVFSSVLEVISLFICIVSM